MARCFTCLRLLCHFGPLRSPAPVLCQLVFVPAGAGCVNLREQNPYRAMWHGR